jgi:hypothetical protein
VRLGDDIAVETYKYLGADPLLDLLVSECLTYPSQVFVAVSPSPSPSRVMFVRSDTPEW